MTPKNKAQEMIEKATETHTDEDGDEYTLTDWNMIVDYIQADDDDEYDDDEFLAMMDTLD